MSRPIRVSRPAYHIVEVLSEEMGMTLTDTASMLIFFGQERLDAKH